jgi:hypothetical protein
MLSYKETKSEEEKIKQAVIHYKDFHIKRLLQALPIRDRVYYWTVLQLEKKLLVYTSRWREKRDNTEFLKRKRELIENMAEFE